MFGREGGHRILCVLAWLTLLLVVVWTAQSIVVAHQARTRGLSSGFPAPVTGADVPILGVNVALEQYDVEALDDALTHIAAGGFVWVRQSFYWSQIEPEPDHFDWSVPDRILAALACHPQLRLVAVLEDSPPIPPVTPDRFAAFAGEFAARYGAQVDHYRSGTSRIWRLIGVVAPSVHPLTLTYWPVPRA